jgi:hypothetical protein
MNDELKIKFNTKEYGIFLFYSSFCMLFSIWLSYYMNDYYFTFYFILLFLSSINHWRKPEYGLRRNIDLFIVYSGVVYTLLRVCLLSCEFNRVIILSMLFSCLVFYIIEFICVYYNSNKWVIYHMTLHLYGALMIIFILFDY